MRSYYGVLLLSIAALLASSEALSPTVESNTAQSQLVSSDVIAGAGKRFLRADAGVPNRWAYIDGEWLSKGDAEAQHLASWLIQEKSIPAIAEVLGMSNAEAVRIVQGLESNHYNGHVLRHFLKWVEQVNAARNVV